MKKMAFPLIVAFSSAIGMTGCERTSTEEYKSPAPIYQFEDCTEIDQKVKYCTHREVSPDPEAKTTNISSIFFHVWAKGGPLEYKITYTPDDHSSMDEYVKDLMITSLLEYASNKASICDVLENDGYLLPDIAWVKNQPSYSDYRLQDLKVEAHPGIRNNYDKAKAEGLCLKK